MIENLKNKKIKKDPKEKKKFSGVTIFDSVSKRHSYVKKVISDSELDKERTETLRKKERNIK